MRLIRQFLSCIAGNLRLQVGFAGTEEAVAQITAPQRVAKIKQLLNDLNKVPPERHEVERLPGTGGDPLLCPVIKISVDDVLLNHRSHRVRSQLDDDPEWAALASDPFSEAAQRVVERHVRDARTSEQFAALRDSLEREGQTAPGVMTFEGVLVNANTRVVALRGLEDPAKRYVRVAVLPETVGPDEIALLELRLQMQKELKVDYSLTNEVLFIEELSNERHMSEAQIARELRISPESSKKGEHEVKLRLRMLDLLREMQRIPAAPLPLTFFDSISYEQLRELDRVYQPLIETDPDRARKHLESFLLSIAVGVTPVHQIRKIDSEFMASYMMPQLEDDEWVGSHAPALAKPRSTNGAQPAGVSALSTAKGAAEDSIDVKTLINIVTQRDKRVPVPGTSVVFERDEVKESIKTAIIGGIAEKRRDVIAEDKLEAPAEALKAATKQLTRCIDSLRAIYDTPDFDNRRQRSVEAAFKKHKRTLRTLETELAKHGVVDE